MTDKQNIPHTSRIGVVVERKDSANPWAEATWRPVEALIGASEDSTWKPLDQGEGWGRYYAGSLEIELFKGETEGYKMNLSQPTPASYIVFRPGDNDEEPDGGPVLARPRPSEAES